MLKAFTYLMFFIQIQTCGASLKEPITSTPKQADLSRQLAYVYALAREGDVPDSVMSRLASAAKHEIFESRTASYLAPTESSWKNTIKKIRDARQKTLFTAEKICFKDRIAHSLVLCDTNIRLNQKYYEKKAQDIPFPELQTIVISCLGNGEILRLLFLSFTDISNTEISIPIQFALAAHITQILLKTDPPSQKFQSDFAYLLSQLTVHKNFTLCKWLELLAVEQTLNSSVLELLESSSAHPFFPGESNIFINIRPNIPSMKLRAKDGTLLQLDSVLSSYLAWSGTYVPSEIHSRLNQTPDSLMSEIQAQNYLRKSGPILSSDSAQHAYLALITSNAAKNFHKKGLYKNTLWRTTLAKITHNHNQKSCLLRLCLTSAIYNLMNQPLPEKELRKNHIISRVKAFFDDLFPSNSNLRAIITLLLPILKTQIIKSHNKNLIDLYLELVSQPFFLSDGHETIDPLKSEHFIFESFFSSALSNVERCWKERVATINLSSFLPTSFNFQTQEDDQFCEIFHYKVQTSASHTEICRLESVNMALYVSKAIKKASDSSSFHQVLGKSHSLQDETSQQKAVFLLDTIHILEEVRTASLSAKSQNDTCDPAAIQKQKILKEFQSTWEAFSQKSEGSNSFKLKVLLEKMAIELMSIHNMVPFDVRNALCRQSICLNTSDPFSFRNQPTIGPEQAATPHNFRTHIKASNSTEPEENLVTLYSLVAYNVLQSTAQFHNTPPIYSQQPLATPTMKQARPKKRKYAERTVQPHYTPPIYSQQPLATPTMGKTRQKKRQHTALMTSPQYISRGGAQEKYPRLSEPHTDKSKTPPKTSSKNSKKLRVINSEASKSPDRTTFVEPNPPSPTPTFTSQVDRQGTKRKMSPEPCANEPPLKEQKINNDIAPSSPLDITNVSFFDIKDLESLFNS